MTFESKADYDQWVLQGYTGYGIIGGMMRPVTSEISYEDSAKVLELGR